MTKLSTLVFLGLAASMIMADSQLTFTTTDPKFSGTFTVDATNASNPNLIVTLKIINYNITSWTDTTGKLGLYMGVGFGTTSMASADIINCYYFYKNSASDKPVCYDLQTDSIRTASVDAIQNA